ncbi:Protein artemis [Mactra antiquata]
MSCFEGLMQEYDRVSLDRFDGRNLQSTVYFLSHLHEDHTRGLNGDLFMNRLKSNKDIFLYCSEVTKVLIEASPKYHKISPYVKCLDINSPTTITIPDPLFEEKEQITVTLLPAFHCPGSVMFLIEGNEGTVLYTGDFRWEHFDIEQMHQLRSAESVKRIKSIYIDTTFCCPDNLHIPSRQQCIEAVCEIVREWTSQSPQHVVYIQLRAIYGHEPLINAVARRFNKKVHVSKNKYEVYERIQEFSGHFTYDGTSTQLHACDRMCTVDIDGETVPCKDVHDPEKILYILPTTMYFTQFQQLSLEKIVKRIKSNFYRACYSFHSSYTEIKDLLAYLKPDRAYANVKCPKDLGLNETQYRLNAMLKECKESGAGDVGDGTTAELEVRELGKLNTRSQNNGNKRKGRESLRDSESLDFGSPLKKRFSEISEPESMTLCNKKGKQGGQGRGNSSQQTDSQSTVSTRRSTRLAAAASVEVDTPKKRRKLSNRSTTPELFTEQSKSEDDIQSSFIGSQRSVSELSLFSTSQKSNDASFHSVQDETDWTGGSFLATISSYEDSEGIFVTEDNYELDETSNYDNDDRNNADTDCKVEEAADQNEVKNEPTKVEIVCEKVIQDSTNDSNQHIHVSNVGNENGVEKDNNDGSKDIVTSSLDTNKSFDGSDDLHLHLSGSTIDNTEPDIKEELNKPLSELHGDFAKTKQSTNEVVILDSDSNESINQDNNENLNEVTTATSIEILNDDSQSVEILNDDSQSVVTVEDNTPDEEDALIVQDDGSNGGNGKDIEMSEDLTQDPSYDASTVINTQTSIMDGNLHEENIYIDKPKEDSGDGDSEIKMDVDAGNDGSGIKSEENIEIKSDDESENEVHEDNDGSDDDVVEIVDLTGDDMTFQCDTLETTKPGKKSIKISLSSKNMSWKSKKKEDILSVEDNESEYLVEESDKHKGNERDINKENPDNDNSLEGQSASKENGEKSNSEDSGLDKKNNEVESGISKKELEERAETKRQAMGFVCETDSESDGEESTPPNSPLPNVLYDDYIELSSDSDNEDGASGHRTKGGRGSNKKTDRSADTEPNTGSNSTSSGWLSSQRGGRRHELEEGQLDEEFIAAEEDLPVEQENHDKTEKENLEETEIGNQGETKKERQDEAEKKKQIAKEEWNQDKIENGNQGEIEDGNQNEIEKGNQDEMEKGNQDEMEKEKQDEMEKEKQDETEEWNEDEVEKEKDETEMGNQDETEKSDSEKGNTAENEKVSESIFKKKNYSDRKGHFRSNLLPDNTAPSNVAVLTPLQFYDKEKYSSRYADRQLLSDTKKHWPISTVDARKSDASSSKLHPSMPSVSGESISYPLLIPRAPNANSMISQQSRNQSISSSRNTTQVASWQQPYVDERQSYTQGQVTEFVKPTQTTPRSHKHSNVASVKPTVITSFASLSGQQMMRTPVESPRVDMASIKANIAALTGITVSSAQTADTNKKESGKSLDEMVEELRKLEQMKALLHVVSGNVATAQTSSIAAVPSEPQQVFNNSHHGSGTNEGSYPRQRENETYPAEHRRYDERDEINERQREHKRYEREREDYELWLRERRIDDYERDNRRRPSRGRYHDDYDDRPPPVRRPDFEERIPPYHSDKHPHDHLAYRDLDNERLPPHHMEEFERLQPRYREKGPEYDQPPTRHPDWDPEYGRHPRRPERDSDYNRRPAIRHLDRDPEFDRPPRRPERDPDYDRLPRRPEWGPEFDRPPRRPEWDPEFDRPPRRPEWDPEYDRPPRRPEWDPEFDRPPRRLERDPEFGRPPRRLERDPEFDRPPRRPERDMEYDRRPSRRPEWDPEFDRPPPRRPSERDPEFNRLSRRPEYHRPPLRPSDWDQAYDQPPKRLSEWDHPPQPQDSTSHRPGDCDPVYDRPLSRHQDREPVYERPSKRPQDMEPALEQLQPGQFDRGLEYGGPPYGVEQHNTLHGVTEEGGNVQYTQNNDYQINRNIQTGGNKPDKITNGSIYMKKMYHRSSTFTQKPIVTRVLSRSGQIISMGTMDIPKQSGISKSEVYIDASDKVAVKAEESETSEPVFQTGIIPKVT